MEQKNFLNNIIRSIKRSKINEENLQSGKIIRLDAKKGEILHNKFHWFSFFRDIRYYWVSTINHSTSEMEVQIKDFPTDQLIVVKIKYEVQCLPGNEEKTVLALNAKSYPGVVLNKLIESWLQEFVVEKRRKGIQPVYDYFDYREELKNYLAGKVLEKIGLYIELILKLKYEDDVELFEISTNYFQVRVKDYDDELALKLFAGLAVDKKILAILNYNRRGQLELMLKKKIRKYMLENVALNEFAYDLNGGLKKNVIAVLNKYLEMEGREIAWLNFETNIASELPPLIQEIHHTVSCDIKDYPQKVEIEHKLLFHLEDVGRYKQKKISQNLEEWAKKKLDYITRSIFFEMRYVDILIDFEQTEDKQEILRNVKVEMQEAAVSIGYIIKHLVIEPKLEPLKLKRDGFMVEVKEASFATIDSRVNIKLGIVATGIIKDLRKISQFFIPGKCIAEELKETILNDVRNLIHDVEPEHFYMPFKFPEREPVVETLEKSINEKLIEKFFAENVKVIIKIFETDLINRIHDFMNGNPYNFNIEVYPQRSCDYQDKITFEIEFIIRSVNANVWSTFLSRKSIPLKQEVKNIKETLVKDIIGKFQNIPADVLLTSDVEGAKKLLEIARLSQSKIAAIFGLDISISLLNRKATIMEEANQKILEEQVKAQLEKRMEILRLSDEADMENLKNLQKLKSELLDPDIFDEEKMAEVDMRIQEITRKLSQIQDKDKKILTPSKSESTENRSSDYFIDEFKKLSQPDEALPKLIEKRKKDDING